MNYGEYWLLGFTAFLAVTAVGGTGYGASIIFKGQLIRVLTVLVITTIIVVMGFPLLGLLVDTMYGG